jgi:hypothetical protein
MSYFRWSAGFLCSGVAFGAMTAAAAADDLSALKAQLEVLQSKVSRLETAPAPYVRPGERLVTIRRGQAASQLDLPMRAEDALSEEEGYTIAITPTADMPAPVSEVSVSGEIRTRLLFTSEENNDEDDEVDLDPAVLGDEGIDISNDGSIAGAGELLGYSDDYFNLTARGRLRIDAHTETAIGEVGGIIRLQSTDGSDAAMNIAWGYWQMTPGLQLGGGHYDSLATVRAGLDWNGNGALIGYTGLTNVKSSQFRLLPASGCRTIRATPSL